MGQNIWSNCRISYLPTVNEPFNIFVLDNTANSILPEAIEFVPATIKAGPRFPQLVLVDIVALPGSGTSQGRMDFATNRSDANGDSREAICKYIRSRMAKRGVVDRRRLGKGIFKCCKVLIIAAKPRNLVIKSKRNPSKRDGLQDDTSASQPARHAVYDMSVPEDPRTHKGICEFAL